MVFVVVSDVERQEIQLAVVAESLLITSQDNEVVPLGPAGTQWMQADGKEEHQHQIGERPGGPARQIYGQVDADLDRGDPVAVQASGGGAALTRNERGGTAETNSQSAFRRGERPSSRASQEIWVYAASRS